MKSFQRFFVALVIVFYAAARGLSREEPCAVTVTVTSRRPGMPCRECEEERLPPHECGLSDLKAKPLPWQF